MKQLSMFSSDSLYDVTINALPLKCFSYEIPFTTGAKNHAASINEQFKRRFILKVPIPFMTVTCRQIVTGVSDNVLAPIESAIDDLNEQILKMDKSSRLSMSEQVLRLLNFSPS